MSGEDVGAHDAPAVDTSMPITLRRAIHFVRASSSTSGTGEEVRDDQVAQRRQTEEEREAADRADRQVPQDRRADQRHHVGDEDGVPRPGEPALGAVAHRSAGAHLVLQSFEEHHVRVDGDADRHDEAGDSGQRQRQALRLRQERDDRVDQRARDCEAAGDDQTEQAVVEHHEDEDQARPRRGRRSMRRATSPCRASATRSAPPASPA